jgi:hypothetical protein
MVLRAGTAHSRKSGHAVGVALKPKSNPEVSTVLVRCEVREDYWNMPCAVCTLYSPEVEGKDASVVRINPTPINFRADTH